MAQNKNLADLSAAGVSVWLDDLSRDRIRSGNLAGLIATRSIVGVTTHPTIFQGALSQGHSYDAQLQELAARGADADAAIRTITTDDVRAACDVFAEVFTATGGVDGRVSIEVDPRLAFDTDKTVAQAIELWKIVDRPNLFIKIPATEEGLPAITRVLSEGISVNVTLIFSVARYLSVMGAYLDGIRNAGLGGHDVARIHSVASFFVSRVDTEVDKRLEAIGTPEALELRGLAGLANARLAYAAYQDIFVDGGGHTTTFKQLASSGANRQRALWASTGVKNPDYPDTLYVTELVGPDTVNTMPEKTLGAVADHGTPHGDTISGTGPLAQQVFDRLTAVGIDLDDVFAVLEHEGVDKFVKSWDELLTATRVALAGTKAADAGPSVVTHAAAGPGTSAANAGSNRPR
jgi:transaldolase